MAMAHALDPMAKDLAELVGRPMPLRKYRAPGAALAALLFSKARNASGRTDAGAVAARIGWGVGRGAGVPGRRPPLLGSVVLRVRGRSSTFYPTSIFWRHP